MLRRHKSFSERRRRVLAVKAEVDRLESRSTVTPIGATALGLGLFPASSALGGMHANGGGDALIGPASAGHAANFAASPTMPLAPGGDTLAIDIVPETSGGQGSGGPMPDVPEVAAARPQSSATDDGASLLGSIGASSDPASQESGISTPWHPASSPGGGGATAEGRNRGNGGRGRRRHKESGTSEPRRAGLVQLRRGVLGAALDPRAQWDRGRFRLPIGHDRQPQRPGGAPQEQDRREHGLARQRSHTIDAPGLHPDHPGL